MFFMWVSEFLFELLFNVISNKQSKCCCQIHVISFVKAILMSTHNICFYEEVNKIIS